VQLDGGLEPVHAKVRAYFEQHVAKFPAAQAPQRSTCSLAALKLGLMATAQAANASLLQAFGLLAGAILAPGGTVVAGAAVKGAQFLHGLLADGQVWSLLFPFYIFN
jgi:hypothetical protein